MWFVKWLPQLKGRSLVCYKLHRTRKASFILSGILCGFLWMLMTWAKSQAILKTAHPFPAMLGLHSNCRHRKCTHTFKWLLMWEFGKWVLLYSFLGTSWTLFCLRRVRQLVFLPGSMFLWSSIGFVQQYFYCFVCMLQLWCNGLLYGW